MNLADKSEFLHITETFKSR